METFKLFLELMLIMFLGIELVNFFLNNKRLSKKEWNIIKETRELRLILRELELEIDNYETDKKKGI